LPCANREREERVLLRDVGESDVALRSLEVSFEIFEVLILTASQRSRAVDTYWGWQLLERSALSCLQEGESAPEPSAKTNGVGPEILLRRPNSVT